MKWDVFRVFDLLRLEAGQNTSAVHKGLMDSHSNNTLSVVTSCGCRGASVAEYMCLCLFRLSGREALHPHQHGPADQRGQALQSGPNRGVLQPAPIPEGLGHMVRALTPPAAQRLSSVEESYWTQSGHSLTSLLLEAR